MSMEYQEEVEVAKVKSGRPLVAGLVGLVLGAVAGFMAPSFLGPYLPALVRSADAPLTGPVVGKSREADRLLLTVVASEGATLVTMTKRIDEIDLLVEIGDSVALHTAGYRPFVTNPTLAGVYKLESRQMGASRGSAERGKAPDTIPTPRDTLEGSQR